MLAKRIRQLFSYVLDRTTGEIRCNAGKLYKMIRSINQIVCLFVVVMLFARVRDANNDLVLLFGELLPKHHCESVAYSSAPTRWPCKQHWKDCTDRVTAQTDHVLFSR